MKKFAKWKRLLAALLCVLSLLGMVCSVAASAAEKKERRTVKVGYVPSTNFSEGEKDGEYKSGYAYEYLQKIAYHTGWEYQYVYGDWSAILQKLAEGEVDVMAGVSYLPEHTKMMDFPEYAMGEENYFIYVWQSGEFAALSATEIKGLTIGCVEGSMQQGYLDAWNRANGKCCTIKTYSGNVDLYDAFSTQAVDAVVDSDHAIAPADGMVPLAKVGAADYYLAVRKHAEDLLGELNEAMQEIDRTDPYYLKNLHNKYFSKTAVSSTLSRLEREWLAGHSEIRVGYMNAYLPYCGSDEKGQPTGMLVDVFENLFDQLHMEIQPTIRYIPFESQQEMIDTVTAGGVDVIFPISEDIWFSEELGLYQTKSITKNTLELVFKGDYADLNVRKVGVNRKNLIQYMDSVRRYPGAQIVSYDSMEACLGGLLQGEIDCTITNGLRTDSITGQNLYASLNVVKLPEQFTMCMGVRRGELELLTLLNHGISTLDKNFAVSNAYKYQKHIYQYTLKDFVLENIVVIMAGILSVAVVIIWFVQRDAWKTKQHLAQERELAKNLEDALEAARCANRAKTVFLNNISHDIRTPMNAIIGFTSIAMKQTTEETVRTYLKKISTSSDHLLTLINDVLDISRVESGKIAYTPVPINLCDITDTVLDIMQGYLSDRQLDFRVERPVGSHCGVLTDGVRLREILINVLSNAVKFTEDGGTITFAMGALPGADAQHVQVWYRIADTGIGMSEEFREHIFEEFTQEDGGARTNYKGFGLGMAITKRYVTMLGGTISVESELGKGSTFYIELPMELQEMYPESEADNDDLRDLTGVHVLLAEDNDLNAEIATILLEDAGMKVTHAGDGEVAVKLFSENPAGTFQMILMDIMMPRMNGYEATSAIRSMETRPDGRTIPIIAVTANAFSEDIQESLKVGMNAHLSKPLNIDAVLKTISKILK